MDVVLDTNVLLVSLSTHSKYRWIFDSFINEEYRLCVTTDILMEYEEVISRHMGRDIAEAILQILENAPNVLFVTRYFKWNLITVDPDDNKFVDCAIAANAAYIVSHDKHFRELDSYNFPKVKVVSPDEWKSGLIK